MRLLNQTMVFFLAAAITLMNGGCVKRKEQEAAEAFSKQAIEAGKRAQELAQPGLAEDKAQTSEQARPASGSQ